MNAPKKTQNPAAGPGFAGSPTNGSGLREQYRSIDGPSEDGDGQRIPVGAHDPCSHVANAHRIAKHFRNELLYVEGIGWHTWSPPFRHDELGAIGHAQSLGQIIAVEAGAMGAWVAAAKGEDERGKRLKEMDRRFKWASQSESECCIRASLELARPLLACGAEELDADPHLLGLPNGVLDLRSCVQRAHCQMDRITKIAGCDFDPLALAPMWLVFISEITGHDPALMDYLQRLVGYLLSGVRGEHLLPIFWGLGANGKGTFLGLLLVLLGDYAGGAAPDLLIRHSGTDHPTALAALQGKRLVVVSESDEAGRLNEERVKWITGGDTITARRMRQDFFNFRPTHQLILQTNHKPRIAGTDQGIWRRVRLVPFNVTIPAERQDIALGDKLKREMPGILAWAVEGWCKYKAEGFILPGAVTDATRSYREESDLLASFITEVCVIDNACTAMAGALYDAYLAWCAKNGERPKSQKTFGSSLDERGFVAKKSTRGRMRWRGLGLRESGRSGGSEPVFGIASQGRKTYKEHSQKSSTSSTSSAPTEARRQVKIGGR